MRDIKNVLLCGVGAIGSIFANILNKYNLRVLVDENRYQKYLKEPLFYNDKKLNLKYILPSDKSYKADLAIISTKFDGLKEVIKNIKNFVDENTIIISLLNGITSEEIIAQSYKIVIPSYIIGHSSVRNGRNVTHDGVYKIVFGSDNKKAVEKLKKYFDYTGINYEISDDIQHSMWTKFMLNVSVNQITAVYGLTFGELLADEKLMKLVVDVMKEVEALARVKGISSPETLVSETLQNLNNMIPDGKTSMLQDIEAGRKTEVNIFADVVINLGKKYGIETPLNRMLKNKIHAIELKNISQVLPQ